MMQILKDEIMNTDEKEKDIESEKKRLKKEKCNREIAKQRIK
jgi:hypothetical protein